jgi:hypothetical protein
MAVPMYCRTRDGHVYRIQRSSDSVATDRVRYTLRAVPIRMDTQAFEATSEMATDLVRDKIRNRQIIPTPEATFEQLWQQLRLDIDAP